jgi:thiol-disulfide isomerase/thioredoxin
MLAVTLFLLSACRRDGNESSAAPVEPASGTAPVSAPALASASELPKPQSPSLVVTAVDGAKFDLAQHRGKWVVINFWATWCAPCLKEIPDLQVFDKSREDVELIGLAYEEIEKPDMLAFLKQHGVSYPIAIIDVYAPPADFDTPRGLPMTYLIAPDGKVAKQFLGPITSADLSAAMLAYLKGKSAAST